MVLSHEFETERANMCIWPSLTSSLSKQSTFQNRDHCVNKPVVIIDAEFDIQLMIPMGMYISVIS